jgi:hypothetical protein
MKSSLGKKAQLPGGEEVLVVPKIEFEDNKGDGGGALVAPADNAD